MQIVLGASGAAGSAILTALVEGGLDARGVNRSGPGPAAPVGVDWRTADATARKELRTALTGADVAYMAAQPPYHRWPQEFPAMMLRIIEAAQSAGVRRVVMVDNLYAYGPGSSPMTEQSGQAATDRKGATRAAMADALLATHASGQVEVVIGRASDYFGAHADNSGITALAIEPVAGRGKLRWMGSLDVPHSCAYLPDIARAFVALGTAEDTAGRIWHLPHDPFVVDDSAFRARFPEFVSTPMADAVTATVTHYRQSLPGPAAAS